MHVQIVLFDGFDPLDVVAPFEVLHAGRTATGGAVSVELVSAEGPREVTGGTGGLTLRATAALDPGRPGWVLVPGASGRIGEPGEEAGEDTVPVLLGRALTTPLPELMRAAMAHPEVMVATVCGGSALLAMAGLLEGRRATTHHLGMDLLDATGARAVDARVVDDGDLVSGAGVTSGLDLGLHLLDREIGPRVAHAVEELFAHERRGIVWRARGPEPVAF
ncbi:DJ-1/PfpI family protein [Streptomyces griseoviridis]|uniref:Glutamine amidotransferase n=1 Tax=Streptomyces griseoviridis TaxID=45398 RepID=A0A918GLX3_STRGD|nr:DJ-1/PfpI family protein [Streptomyces niveoruber]GGS46920.1 glutamine amidotransferase [Streptomyces niveoruber]